MQQLSVTRFTPRVIAAAIVGTLVAIPLMPVHAHDAASLLKRRQLVLAQRTAEERAEDARLAAEKSGACALSVVLLDDADQPVPGLVRLTNLASGKELKLTGEFHRANNWYSLAEQATVQVPQSKLRVEAFRGLDSERSTTEIDLTGSESARVVLSLRQFYDARARGLRAGNTHLHLMNMTHDEADRYLRLVPRTDNLDLVFLSFLRRVPDERNYISNPIVERSFAGGDLARLSDEQVLFSNGQEHRHNFGRFGEGYGHVMFLDLQQLIRPISLGPGIMGDGTDGVPLRRGMRRARKDGATVIWCHNRFGYEAIPSWLDGLLHAQNIFDGGDHGSYESTFYRYLNLGLKVPFSTGTDWLIYDFSRVYVPVHTRLTSADWLTGLREGRSFITNGPFLEIETERGIPGDTLTVDGPNRVTVVGRAMGRQHFRGLELIYNGRVAHRVPAQPEQGYHFAELRHSLNVTEPGWFALRIPQDAGESELGGPLFAHTSPIYVSMPGRQLFRKDVARELIAEINQAMDEIERQGRFADDAERQAVHAVYARAIKQLEQKIAAAP